MQESKKLSLIERRRLSEQTRCLILADFLEGVPDKVIAERYGCVASYPRVLARREGLKRKRSLRTKKFHEKREIARDWLRVSTKHHKARERHNKRDWIHL